MRADVIAYTQVARPSLVPEISLRLITHESALWSSDEGWLARLGWSLPFWAFAWPGGQVLARYLIDHPSVVRGQRVLDFGCGGEDQRPSCGVVPNGVSVGGGEDATEVDGASGNRQDIHIVVEIRIPGGQGAGGRVDGSGSVPHRATVRRGRHEATSEVFELKFGSAEAQQPGFIGAPRRRVRAAVEAWEPEMYSHGEVELWRSGGGGQEATGQASPQLGESFFCGLVG